MGSPAEKILEATTIKEHECFEYEPQALPYRERKERKYKTIKGRGEVARKLKRHPND